MNITIDSELKSKCKASLGCLSYQADVKKEDEELWKYIDSFLIPQIEKEFTLESLSKQMNIAASREAYKNLGKEPSRYRVSSEALIRRILQGKGLYHINTVVDTNNLISIETGYSVGSYDLDHLEGDICFRKGNEREEYQGIGKGMINIANLPVFVDEKGPYGSPTSDSTRAMIQETSKRILTILISFRGKEGLEEAVEKAKGYLQRYANATDIQTLIV